MQGEASKVPAADYAVVNLLSSEADWSTKLEEAMRRRDEIVLLTFGLDPHKQRTVSELCGRHRYSQPQVVTERDWPELQRIVNLTGQAQKEQGVSRNTVYLLSPESVQSGV